jgi:hypothetical protein
MEADTSAEVTIPLSKTKVALLVLGAVAFVGGSVWLWMIAETQGRYNPLFVKGIALAGAAFFGLCGVYGCVKIIDGKPGLIIDAAGIVDNSSAVAAGRIPWGEITGLRVCSIAGQRFLTIDVADPKKYVARGGSFRRMMNAANARLTGSPINISASSLCVQFDELVHLLTEASNRHRGAARTGV